MFSVLRKELHVPTLITGLWPVRQTLRFAAEGGVLHIEGALGKVTSVSVRGVRSLEYVRRTSWYSEFVVPKWELTAQIVGAQRVLLTTLLYDRNIAKFAKAVNEALHVTGGELGSRIRATTTDL